MIVILFLKTLTNVDSSPTLHFLSSIIIKFVSKNWSNTIFAFIGLSFLNLFADGIIIGLFKRDITFKVNKFFGILTAQYSFFDKLIGICFDFLFKIKVKGPGQNFLASSKFSSSKIKNFLTISILEQ